MYDKLQKKFEQACKDNNLSMVKYLLGKPSFKKHIDVTSRISIHVEDAFDRNNLELVDFFFSQPEITDDIKNRNINDTFCNACFNGRLDLVKEIFYNEKYNPYISLEYNSTWCFRTSFRNNKKDILKFLILDAKLSQNNEWVQAEIYESLLKTETIKFCESLFSYVKMSDNLPESTRKNPLKPKI